MLTTQPKIHLGYVICILELLPVFLADFKNLDTFLDGLLLDALVGFALLSSLQDRVEWIV